MSTTPIKQNIVHHVCDTAMHILNDSDLYWTKLWPKNGFKAGYGIGSEVKDRIYYFCAIWDILATPPTGHLQFNIHNTPDNRESKQVDSLKLIYDQSYLNNIFFEDLYPNSAIRSLRFKFTITQPLS
jgi:hypothetical protein